MELRAELANGFCPCGSLRGIATGDRVTKAIVEKLLRPGDEVIIRTTKSCRGFHRLTGRLRRVAELLASIPESEIVAKPAQKEEARSRLRELKSSRALGLAYGKLKVRLG